MCPIVPTLTCGLVRVNVSLAIVTPCSPVLDYAQRRFGITEKGGRMNHHTLAPTDVATLWKPGRNRPQSCRWDLNPGPRPYQGRALPTEPRQHRIPLFCSSSGRSVPPAPDSEAGDGNRTHVACLEG